MNYQQFIFPFYSVIRYLFFYFTFIVLISSCGKTDFIEVIEDINHSAEDFPFPCDSFDIVSIDSTKQEIQDNDNPSHIEITKLFKLSSISHYYAQGFAIYDKYLFNCHHSNDIIDVFDLETQKSIAYLHLEPDMIIHCNNVNFGSEFYSENDRFPILYIQQRGYACKLNAYRIICSGDTFLTAEKVQTIYFGPCKSCINAIDTRNNLLYALYDYNGKNFISSFQMPSVHAGDITINLQSAYKSYYSPYTKICQDTAFDDKFLYILCGYNNEGELWIIDMDNKKARVIDLPKYNLFAEPEGIDIYNRSIIVSFPNKPLYCINIQE